MKLKIPVSPLVKIPPKIDLILFLIREELKSRKLFKCLGEIGCSDITYQSELSELILSSIGFEDRTDELYLFYYNLLHKYSAKLNGNEEHLMKQVFKVYVKLVGRRSTVDGPRLGDS